MRTFCLDRLGIEDDDSVALESFGHILGQCFSTMAEFLKCRQIQCDLVYWSACNMCAVEKPLSRLCYWYRWRNGEAKQAWLLFFKNYASVHVRL